MLVSELIQKLQELNPSSEVVLVVDCDPTHWTDLYHIQAEQDSVVLMNKPSYDIYGHS